MPRQALTRPLVAVATSGGRDSTALLHLACRLGRAQGFGVVALHVNHGLQANAKRWEALVLQQVRDWARRGYPVQAQSTTLTSSPEAGDSVEAWARRERYAALARLAQGAGASLVLLAHHRRDQAETVLLQALRGAGPAGLSAMPVRRQADGLTWARPWLHQPREAIEAYLRRWQLRWVEDDSNQNPRFDRNRLRLQVWPALTAAFPQAEPALEAVAEEAAWTRQLLDEVAAADLEGASDEDGGLSLPALLGLSPARQRLVVRRWLEQQGGQGASGHLLSRLCAELPAARQGRWPAGQGREVRLYRGQLRWHAARLTTLAAEEGVQAVRCLPASLAAGRYRLLGAPGDLELRPVAQGGVDARWLPGARWVARSGGEQFQLHARSTPRALKKQFQALGVPAWARGAPLLRSSTSSGDKLIFVPGLGVDARMLASPGVTQWALRWWPDGETPA